MRTNKYYIKKDELQHLVKNILPRLFPEFNHVEASEDYVSFSKHKRGTWNYWLSSMIDSDHVVRIHLFELLVYHIPKRLSYYRTGNYSFSAQYTSFIFSIILTNTKYLIPYVIKEFNEISYPFVEQTKEEFFDVLYSNENLNKMQNNAESFMKNLFIAAEQPKDFTFHGVTVKL